MRKTLTLIIFAFFVNLSFAQGTSDPKTFPKEWLTYEYYEHQLFFTHNSLEFFKQEVSLGTTECFVRTYSLKTKKSTWQKVKGINAEGFTYDEPVKKGVVEKTVLFDDVTDWKFSKNGMDYGYYSKSQLISFNTLDENYNSLLNNIMNDFYKWRFALDTRGYNMPEPNTSKPSFELVYDIMNFEDKSYQIQYSKDVERTPQFPGGIYWMHKYIGSKIDYKKYKDYGIDPIFVRFSVLEDGTVANIAIVKGEINPAMDELVAKMVHEMPRWIPGYKDGKTVETTVFLPIYFND